MATISWVGGAPAVVQVATGSIDSVDGTPANNTFTVTIGGVAINQAGDTDVATTAAALVALLNASVHPYFSAVTWTNPSAGDIVGTADVPGVPFVAALTETGAGTGAVTDFAATVASAGPSDWSTAANWGGGVLPATGDTVIIGSSAGPIVYGLDQTAVALSALDILRTFSYWLGLHSDRFATSADGASVNTSAPEYRPTYLIADIDDVQVGVDQSLANSGGPSRVKVNNLKTSGVSNTIINSGVSSGDSPLPGVRLLFANAAANVIVQQATGGVGIACEPGEISTVGDIWHTPEVATDRLVVGWGCTWTNMHQTGGNSSVQAANTPTKLEVRGGECVTMGKWQLGTLCVGGGTVIHNAWHTGTPITAIDLQGGHLNVAAVGYVRKPTAGTLSLSGGAITMNSDLNSFTVINEPEGGNKMISVS